jgi:hypothetical protein
MMHAYIILLVLAFAVVVFAQDDGIDIPSTPIPTTSSTSYYPSSSAIGTIIEVTTSPTTYRPSEDSVATATSPIRTRTSSTSSIRTSSTLPASAEKGSFIIYDNAAADVIANSFTVFLVGSTVAAGVVYQMI